MSGLVDRYRSAMQMGAQRLKSPNTIQGSGGEAQFSLPNTPPPNTTQYYQRGAGYETNAANQRAQNAVQFNGTQPRGVYPSDMRDAMNQGAAAGMSYQNYQPMGTLVDRYLNKMAPNRMQPMGQVYRR